MKTNRLLAVLLTICLFAGLCCVPVYAQTTDSGACGDNATWTFDGATATQNADTTISYNCKNCSAIKIEGTPVVPTETTVPPTQSNETTAATVETDNPNDATADTTIPSETQPDAGDRVPGGGFPWGLVIGISVAVLAGGGIGLWVWLKKKQQL